MFKWACLGFAVVSVLGFAWLTNDLRVNLQRTTQTVNEKLPEILEKTRRSTEILAALAEDMKNLRDLAGASSEARDRSLVSFADGILDRLEQTEARIGLEKKVFGSGLKETLPTRDWVVGARKEAVWQTFRCKSKEELVQRLCENMYGSKWWIQVGETPPQPLEDWIRANHPEAAGLGQNDPSATVPPK